MSLVSELGKDTVLVAVDDSVATITLNRPNAMNALNIATKEALRDALNHVAADPVIRAVVLTGGGGRAFCVGQDLNEHMLAIATDSSAASQTVSLHYNPMVRAIATMPKPVVAAVNGVAAGAGASLAFAADFRVVADSAGFNTAFAGIALSCDTGSSWTLPRLVGMSKAKHLLYFPRTVGAAEALEIGLASEVVPAEQVLDRALELARTLAAGPTAAYAAMRHMLEFSATHSLDEALSEEERYMSSTFQTADHGEAVTAFIAKRPPVFTGH